MAFSEKLARQDTAAKASLIVASKKPTDFADLALQAICHAIHKQSYRPTFEYRRPSVGAGAGATWDSYEYATGADFSAFVKKVCNMLATIHLRDADRLTEAIPLKTVQAADLLIFTIRGNGFTGHTMIVVDNDSANEILTVAEGHLVRSGPPTTGSYTYEAIEKHSYSLLDGMARRWRWSKIAQPP